MRQIFQSVRAPRPFHTVESQHLPPDIEIETLPLTYPAQWFAPVDQHPCAEAVEDQTLNWMHELGLLRDAAQEGSVRAMCPRFYGGCSGSMLSFETDLLYTRYLTMWLLWDDEVIETSTHPHALEPYFRAMEGTVHAPELRGYHLAWHQVGRALKALGASKALEMRWTEAMRRYAGFALSETAIRNDPDADRRSFEEAFLMRTYTIGAAPAVIYLEACCGAELPEVMADTHDYQRWAHHAAVLQALQNDIASVPKDLRKEEFATNMVLRHWRDHGGALRESYQAMLDLHDRSVEAFDDCVHLLLARTRSDDRERLQQYFDHVRYMETGFGFYHVRAERYRRDIVVDSRRAYRSVLNRR